MRCCSPGGRPGRERLPRDLRGGHDNPATGQVRAPSRSVPRRCARHLARRRGRGGRLPAASLGGKDVGDGRGGAWDTGSNTVVCEGAGREGCAAHMTAVQSSATHPSPRSGAETRETSQQLATRATESTSPASAARRPGSRPARGASFPTSAARGAARLVRPLRPPRRVGWSVGYDTGSTVPASAARGAEGTTGRAARPPRPPRCAGRHDQFDLSGLCGARGGTCATTPVRPRRLPRSAGRQVRPGARRVLPDLRRRVLPDLRGAPGGNGFYLAGLSGAPCRPSRHTGRRA